MSTRSYNVRRNLGHPVIDSDCHWAELYPIYLDFLREVSGASALERFKRIYGHLFGAWYSASPQDRRTHRMRRPPYWGAPTSSDRIATLVPRLFRESLDDWGIDVAVLYPTVGLLLHHMGDRDLSDGAIKAYNIMVRELFAAYSDRVIAVGVVNL